ncbi:MAG TPA: hypothetical protein IAA51_06790 [Candidatus Cottocaccamicrobium excrementipullorum]|nr:hypothetical protein [Candidatus Cottocaccamicrobium excrementipullorum]
MMKNKIDCLLIDRSDFEKVLDAVTPGTAFFATMKLDRFHCIHILQTFNWLGLLEYDDYSFRCDSVRAYFNEVADYERY